MTKVWTKISMRCKSCCLHKSC